MSLGTTPVALLGAKLPILLRGYTRDTHGPLCIQEIAVRFQSLSSTIYGQARAYLSVKSRVNLGMHCPATPTHLPFTSAFSRFLAFWSYMRMQSLPGPILRWAWFEASMATDKFQKIIVHAVLELYTAGTSTCALSCSSTWYF